MNPEQNGEDAGPRYGEWIFVQRVHRRPMKTAVGKGNVVIQHGRNPRSSHGEDQGESSGVMAVRREKVTAKQIRGERGFVGGAVKGIMADQNPWDFVLPS